MWHEDRLGEDFFEQLSKIDERIAQQVAARRCGHCGGPLHRGNYERKPRGAAMAEAGEAFRLRYSLCCGRRGCRKRALPPSLRFLGRRVYLEAVVLLASVRALTEPTLRAARAVSGVAVRTLRRWGSWWTGVFPTLGVWTVLRGRFVPPPPNEAELPKSLLDRLAASLSPAPRASEVLWVAAQVLAAVTTGSVFDGSRFVRAAFG